MIKFVSWELCKGVWEECNKTNTACGCIGVPTFWGILLVVGLAFLIVFLLKFITFTNQTQSKLKGGIE